MSKCANKNEYEAILKEAKEIVAKRFSDDKISKIDIIGCYYDYEGGSWKIDLLIIFESNRAKSIFLSLKNHKAEDGQFLFDMLEEKNVPVYKFQVKKAANNLRFKYLKIFHEDCLSSKETSLMSDRIECERCYLTINLSSGQDAFLATAADGKNRRIIIKEEENEDQLLIVEISLKE